jgi:hypothetical protein
MTDDFVKKAFSDADMAIVDKEFDAYMKTIGGDEGDVAHTAAAYRVGFAKMDKLCEVVFKGGEVETFAEYAHTLMLVGFHLGYRAALEDRE